MPMFTKVDHKQGHQPPWLRVDVLARLQQLRLTEVEQDEEHCLEAMCHWHNPDERLKPQPCRVHTLADDNPTSG
jgi:hypothetical protein